VAKVDSVLRRGPPRASLDQALVVEVQTVLKAPQERRNLAVIKSLLSAGASINTIPKAPALSQVVKSADPLILDIFFNAGPTAESLASALPQSLNIVDPMDRLSFTQKLINAGAPDDEINRALVYAITAHPLDHPLIGLLANHANTTEGEALTLAVTKEYDTLVGLLLEKSAFKYSKQVLRKVFGDHATKVENREKRVAICRMLLKQGVSGGVVSDALLAAAAEGDLALGAVLMDYGASVEHNNGQAIIEASGAGAPEVLRMLLATNAQVSKETLDKGFQAAALVSDLKKRVGVFRLLLGKGVSSELVDMELISAAKFGEDGEELVRLLLEFEANVDHSAGEAIWNTTRSAMMGSLKLMLGIDNDQQAKPSTATLLRALRASRKLERDPRYQVIKWLFEAGLPATEEIHIALNRAVKDDPDLRLIRLLMSHGASPLENGCQTLIDTAQMLLPDVLAVLLEADISQQDISWTFEQAFTPATATTWLSEKGLQNAQLILQRGAEGMSLSLALSVAIDAYGTENNTIARQFANLVLQHKPDVSYKDGLVVRKAAQGADSELIELILKQKPDSCAVSMAFPYLFDSDLPEEDIIQLVRLFTDYHDGEERLDVMFSHPESEPVVFRALAKFPRSLKLLETLLDAGYYYDQKTTMRVMEEIEEDEPASILLWALLQPQKKISSSIIISLIQRGANVNFETPSSKTTPLMLAIQAKRTDLVRELIFAGAEVNVIDATNNTPMTMATKIGGEIGTSIMSMILAADPSKDDGSLHNAARELNLDALQILLHHGHDLDFPSPLHDGRSVLGEVCLNAAHVGPLTAAQEKLMEKVMMILIKGETDLTIQARGKSALLLALHSNDPIPTTRALLKIGMWKLLNRPFNQYNDGTYTYSPTQYVARVLPDSDHKEGLLELLKANRAIDVYYANEGPQPEGAVNLPDELLRAERERKAREERISRDTQEHQIVLARTKEIAEIHNQIFKTRAELEDSRARRNREGDLNGLRERQAIEAQGFAEELRRRQAEREASIRHEQKLLEAGLSRSRLIAEADMERDGRKHELQIEWENKRTAQAVANAQQLSAIRVRERQAIDQFDAAADQRTIRRIEEHKRLVDSQNVLASQLASGGGNPRRQIGYVEGELNP
jgi:ankyrin repeat protein